MKKRKTYEISVIDKTYSKTLSDETKFYTSDTALELGFELKETEYTFESAEIVLLNIDDRSLVTRPVAKVLDSFAYELENDIIAHYGEWRGQLRFEQNGEVYVSSPVIFRIENDLNNERPSQLSDVQSWVSLKRYADKLTEELKQAVLSVEGIEDTFNANELERQAIFENNESERDETFESNETTRQAQELEREKAETQRQTAFDGNEAIRTETFNTNEATRQVNESARQQAESGRQSAEQGRVEAEKARVEGYQEVRNVIDNFEIGVNAVDTENIKDRAVTLDKVSFSKKGKNLFDKSKATLGYVNNVTGAISSSTTYYASDFMPAKPNTQYTRSHLGRLAFYDANKAFISGLNDFSNYTITTPASTAYTRHTIDNQAALDAFQFEEGNVRTPYEPYRNPVIESKYIEDKDIDFTKIPNDSISKEKLNFIKVGKNLFDKSKAKDGYYVANGIEKTNADLTLSDAMPVEPNTSYIGSSASRFLDIYDGNGNVLSTLSNVSGAFTTPANSATVKASIYLMNKDTFQLEKGTSYTYYEPFGYVLEGIKVGGESSDGVEVTLPPKIYAVVGQSLNIYFKNIIDKKDTLLDFDVTSSLGKQMADRWTTTPTAKGTNILSVSVYQDSNLIGSRSTSVVTSDITTKDTSVLYFGDSTVNAGGLTKRLLDLYSAETSNLTLLGTRGLTATNRYEGRGGWTAASYRGGGSYEGAVNPFYNQTKTDFDFAYYMSNQGYATPDHFIIQLGINDTFGLTSDSTLNAKIDTILNDFDFIIGNVKAYSSAIKIGVTVTIPPNASQDAFGNAYGNGQAQWRYKRNNAIWVKRLIDHFKGKESQNIYLVPMQHNIDTTTNIADGVHPNQVGYDQIGDSVYAYLKNIG